MYETEQYLPVHVQIGRFNHHVHNNPETIFAQNNADKEGKKNQGFVPKRDFGLSTGHYFIQRSIFSGNNNTYFYICFFF